jgi:hypothetical protein
MVNSPGFVDLPRFFTPPLTLLNPGKNLARPGRREKTFDFSGLF